MKKIYKSLAVAALAMMANAAFGQNLVVTADGKPVANGDVIEVPYEVEDYSEPSADFYWYSFIWDPCIEVSTGSGKANMTLTVTSVDNSTGFTACWPVMCQQIGPNGSLTTNGEISTVPANLQIHKEFSSQEPGFVPTESDGGSVKVLLESGSEAMEFTVKCLISDKNGVGENFADSNAPTVYYTLEGIQVENPTKGIYVMRKGGKAKLIKK